jgi:hypothetical protein
MDHADDGGDDDVFIYRGGLIPQHLRDTITHVRVHESVKIITQIAFFMCRNLVSIEMHDGVEIIGLLAFADCSSLRGIKLQSVRVIKGQAFYNCRALEDVQFGNNLETIEGCAFQGTSLRIIKIPKVRVIEDHAFWDCEQLTDVELSEDLETIEDCVFENCPNLRRVALPLKDNLLGNDIEDIDAFYKCKDLSQVDLVGGIHKTISSLLLDSWRNEMNDEIDSINQDLPNTHSFDKTVTIRQWMETVIRRIEHYKSEHYALLKNNMTQLELALWKANQHKEEDEKHPAKKAKIEEPSSAKTVDANLPNVDAARQRARFTCGANLIIPHVLSFLNDPEEFPIRDSNL